MKIAFDKTMIRIADHIESAQPFYAGSNVYKATRSDGHISAIEVFPFQLPREEYPFFEKQVSLLSQAISEYRTSIPRILSWGFTQTGFFPYIEMEWTEGYDLSTLNQQKAITINEIGKIAEEISRVLTYCHNLGVIHGNIGTADIVWDNKNDRYVLKGFRFGLQRSKLHSPAEETRIYASLPQPDLSAQQKDIHDFGLVLFQLTTENLLANEKINLVDLSLSPGEVKLIDGTPLPLWLATCITKAVGSPTEERFKSASQMYHYIILHHKTPFQKNRWYRSKPQQPLTVKPGRTLKSELKSSKKSKSLLASGLQRGRKEMRFVFDRRIAVGLIIAGLLAGFSIVAQNREKQTKNDSDTTAIANAQQRDTANFSSKKQAKENSPRPNARGKQKSDTPQKNKDAKKIDVQKDSVVQPSEQTEQETNTSEDLGTYKVISKAYFHNEPDESSKRNAFIVHWNNAILHPLKEENDFIYVVFTNHLGQTSKGWLRKKDLIKL